MPINLIVIPIPIYNRDHRVVWWILRIPRRSGIYPVLYISLTPPTNIGGASEASFSVAAPGRGIRRCLIPSPVDCVCHLVPHRSLVLLFFVFYLADCVAPTTCAANAATVVSGNGVDINVAIRIHLCPTTTTMTSFQVFFNIYFVILDI